MDSRSASSGGGVDKAGALQKLVELSLLSEDEKMILAERQHHATTLWCWIQALCVEVLEMCKVPPPNVNMLYQEVRHAMAGIHAVKYYLHTQLPFPYVHMITLLVNLNSLVISTVAGVQAAIGLDKGRWAVACCNAFKVFMLPVLYQGLLQICVFLSDPLGDDIIDFPIRQYQKEV